MKLSFSTLGCPKWGIDEVISKAVRFGFEGVGIRGIQGEMDFARIPAFSPSERAVTRKKFQKSGLDLYVLLSSSKFTSPDADERQANLEAAKKTMDLAAFMGARLVRVFGGKIAEDVKKEQAYGWVVDSFKRLGDHGASKGVIAVMETHDDFTDSALCRKIMERTNHPFVKLQWDVHHPFRSSRERIADTWKNIGPWVWDTHFKDSMPDRNEKKGYRNTLLGEGDVPNIEALRILKKNGFHGYLCFEWENPYQPEAEIAFPHYVATMREYLARLQ